MKFKKAFVTFALLGTWSAQGGSTITLQDYLDQVKSAHQGYQASTASKAAAEQKKDEAKLVYSSNAFMESQYSDDRRITLSAAFLGTETTMARLSLGVSKLTEFGLQTKLSYNLLNTVIVGASPLLVTTPSFYDAGLGLDISLPIWRNAFGRATAAMVTAAQSQAKATEYIEAFKNKGVLADAEMKYWRLAIAQEIVRVQKESLDRALKMREFNQKRVANQLADSADLLQSEAAVKARELDLKSSQLEEIAAKRAFNSARSLASNEVAEELSIPPVEVMEAYEIPVRSEKREDLLAAEQGLKAANANYDSVLDKQYPAVELFASGSLNGRNPAISDALSGSVSANPYTAIGIRMNVPLDLVTVQTLRAAYTKENQGAELNYQRKAFEQETEWRDLVAKFEETKLRLKMAFELQQAQQAKLEYERKRQKEGQSTTFQVFLFEQEFLGSQATRIQLQGLILNLLAQMKTFSR